MRALLHIRPPAGEPFEVEIGNTATIGRGRDNTVSLATSPLVSRQHAIIRCHNSWQYQIMDLGSRNGTFVNGRRVITPVTLDEGAAIRAADTEITLRLLESPEAGPLAEMTMAAGTSVAGDHTATVAVMVCDIRGFSTMSEILPEDQLARTLGDWFRQAGDILQSEGGSIDKFIGDAVLAYWVQAAGEPGEEARRAFAAGVRLLETAAGRRWPHDATAPFRIAVALHHGPVTCGNIGLVAQRDATIIGDTVNTVFRMEGVMKQFDQRLTASADFVSLLATPERERFEDLGEHQLKGKNQHVRLAGLRP